MNIMHNIIIICALIVYQAQSAVGDPPIDGVAQELRLEDAAGYVQVYPHTLLCYWDEVLQQSLDLLLAQENKSERVELFRKVSKTMQGVSSDEVERYIAFRTKLAFNAQKFKGQFEELGQKSQPFFISEDTLLQKDGCKSVQCILECFTVRLRKCEKCFDSLQEKLLQSDQFLANHTDPQSDIAQGCARLFSDQTYRDYVSKKKMMLSQCREIFEQALATEVSFSDLVKTLNWRVSTMGRIWNWAVETFKAVEESDLVKTLDDVYMELGGRTC